MLSNVTEDITFLQKTKIPARGLKADTECVFHRRFENATSKNQNPREGIERGMGN